MRSMQILFYLYIIIIEERYQMDCLLIYIEGSDNDKWCREHSNSRV